jgi:hypothetical protein
MPEQLNKNAPKKDLSAEQKVAFLLLMILGVGGLILGIRSFKTQLTKPFDLQLVEYANELFQTPSQQREAEVERQKLMDTDNDGLNDYDELYVFKTSAYLADSDSDGIDDYTEVYEGGDPNCPIGRDCNAQLASPDGQTNPSADVDGLIPNADINPLEEVIASGEATAIENPDDIYSLLGDLSIEEIRTMLLDAGMSQEQLDALDDDTLMAVFSEALSQTQASGAVEEFLDDVVPVEEGGTTTQTTP